MSTEVQIVDNAPRTSPNQLIALALEKGADPATIEKLMDLQERYEAGQARKAYVVAMAGFKAEAPAVLAKCDSVDFTTAKGRTCYNYANLGSICREIAPIMAKYGLSASWETSQDANGNVIVTCHNTHSAGHRESVTLRARPDDSGNKNSIQAIGSVATYLSRYTLLAVLGLATGDDDDGMGGAKEPREPIQQPRARQEDATATSSEVKTDKNVIIEDVTTKSGTTNGKEWIRYSITIGGRVFGTFSRTIAGEAEKYKGSTCVVSYTFDPKKGLTIVELVPILAPEAE